MFISYEKTRAILFHVKTYSKCKLFRGRTKKVWKIHGTNKYISRERGKERRKEWKRGGEREKGKERERESEIEREEMRERKREKEKVFIL